MQKQNTNKNTAVHVTRSMLRAPRSGGFSIVEILLACSIILFSIFAVMVLAKKSSQLAREALDQTAGSLVLEEGAEAVKVVRDNGWANITALSNGTTYYPTFSGGTWTLSTSAATAGIFTRTVVFSDVYRNGTDDIASSGTLDTSTKEATVSISWPEEGTTLTKSFSFYVMNI